MFVVRKFNFELALVFGLRRLVSAIRFAKSETAIFARRGPQVTDRADRRARAAHGLTGEELRPVTTNARIVIGKICDVGKRPVRSPGSRNLVTSVALETLVLVG